MTAFLVIALLAGFQGGRLLTENEVKSEQRRCILMQTDMSLYGDGCAESSSGYENMNGSDAHFDGAACVADLVRECLR